MKKEIEIKLTSEELAKIFINWSNDEQANFINSVGEHFKQADFNAEFQCAIITDYINKIGKDFIYTLANFLKAKKFKDTSHHFDRLINTYDCDSL